MAPNTRSKAKRAKAGARDPKPKQTMESKLYINTREDEGHRGASVRSENTKTALQVPANAAAKVSAAPPHSMEPVDPRESAEVPSPVVLPGRNGRGSRRRGRLPAEDELDVADFLVTEDFRDRWESGVTAATILQLKNDPDYSPAVQM